MATTGEYAASSADSSASGGPAAARPTGATIVASATVATHAPPSWRTGLSVHRGVLEQLDPVAVGVLDDRDAHARAGLARGQRDRVAGGFARRGEGVDVGHRDR